MPSGLACGYLDGFRRASSSWTSRFRLALESGFSANADAKSLASFEALAAEGLVPVATAIISLASFCFWASVTTEFAVMAARSDCRLRMDCGVGGGGVDGF